MKTPQEMTKKDIATILAARQLGDTIYDHPARQSSELRHPAAPLILRTDGEIRKKTG